jgi:hypothetical protein
MHRRDGDTELSPQAGIGVYERAPVGLLAAVRVYDDVEPPAGRVTTNVGRFRTDIRNSL